MSQQRDQPPVRLPEAAAAPRRIERITSPPPPAPGMLAWQAVLRGLLARRWLVLAVALLCTLSALLYALAARPVYEADMLLHVEEDRPSTPNNVLNDVSSLFEPKTAATAEMELLRSRQVVARAVDTLHLYIEVRPRYFPLGGEWLAAKRGSELSAPGLFGHGGYVWGGERLEVERFDVPDALLQRNLIVTALGGGRYRLGDGARALLNGVVGAPAVAALPGGALALTVTELRGRPGAQFVLRRVSRLMALQQLRDALQISEQGKQSGVIQARLQGPDPLRVYAALKQIGSEYMRLKQARRTEEAEKTLSVLERQLPALKAQLESAETRYTGFRSGHDSVNVEQEVRVELDRLTLLQERRAGLQQKRAEMAAGLGDAHPQLLALDRQLAVVQRDVDAAEARLRQLPPLEQAQGRLARDVKLGNDLYTELQNTAQQLRLIAVGSISNVQLIDAPAAPERALKPNRPLIVLLGAVTGVFLGALLALAAQGLRGGIADTAHIEALLGGRSVHATVPHSRALARRRRQPGMLPASDAAGASLRAFRATVQVALRRCASNIACCAGPLRGAGVGALSAQLARLLAAGGKRTLLIDANLRDGRLHDAFEVPRAPGLADCLAGAAPQAVRQAVAERLDLLPAGAALPQQAELLERGGLDRLLAALAPHYDVVLLAAPPVLAGGDALIVAGQAGAVFVVVRAGVTTEAELSAAIQRLHHGGVAPHGVLFNDA